MRLCAIIKQGKIAYVTLVPDNHEFGIHGDHYHMRVPFLDTLDVECTRMKERKHYGTKSSDGSTGTTD
jgi:hypothetical protein